MIDPLVWRDFENAVQAAVVAGSGLVGAKVIWRDQSRDRTVPPFITLEIMSNFPISPATPEQRTDDNPTGTPGVDDLIITSFDEIEIEVRVQAYSGSIVTTAANAAPLPARVLLNKVVRYLGTEGAGDRLDEKGIVMVDHGTITIMPALLETEIEGRAAVVVRFRVKDAAQEKTTYIETVETSTTLTQ